MRAPRSTAKRNLKEETISISGSDLVELIPYWADLSPTVLVDTGRSVNDTMDRGRRLRHAVRSDEPLPVDLHDQSEAADVLYAVCRLLMHDCTRAPRQVLKEAAALHELLRDLRWPDDDLEEKRSLLCSLAFVAWRATRILGWSREVHRWEYEYKLSFRQSLSCHAIEGSFDSGTFLELGGDAIATAPETLFQVLIFLHDSMEVDPKRASDAAQAIYRLIESSAEQADPDLRLYFLGETARLAGLVLRSVGSASDVAEWLDRAEEHFRTGVNPEPGLARIRLVRSAVFHNLGRSDVAAKAAPELEATLTALGMEEERVKCRILWASSLKLEGRPREALDVMEPVREWRSRIRPTLYGWVLLQLGDIHQSLADYENALKEFGEAARLFREGKQFVGLADLHLMISCIYRAQGRLDEALHLLETSRQDHARLEMTWPEGYHRMLIAETYLAMGRPREAEKEIRAALPLLEEQGMLADAVIAVNLLREAVRQRKLDPADNRVSFKPKKRT